MHPFGSLMLVRVSIQMLLEGVLHYLGETGWSEPAPWSMGCFPENNWKGRWIGYDGTFPWDKRHTNGVVSALVTSQGVQAGAKQ